MGNKEKVEELYNEIEEFLWTKFTPLSDILLSQTKNLKIKECIEDIREGLSQADVWLDELLTQIIKEEMEENNGK